MLRGEGSVGGREKELRVAFQRVNAVLHGNEVANHAGKHGQHRHENEEAGGVLQELEVQADAEPEFNEIAVAGLAHPAAEPARRGGAGLTA